MVHAPARLDTGALPLISTIGVTSLINYIHDFGTVEYHHYCVIPLDTGVGLFVLIPNRGVKIPGAMIS